MLIPFLYFVATPSDWYINAADKYGLSKQKRKYFPCRKCHKAGHTEKECRKNIVCYICGQFNHMFTRCPNSLCLTVGRSILLFSVSGRKEKLLVENNFESFVLISHKIIFKFYKLPIMISNINEFDMLQTKYS